MPLKLIHADITEMNTEAIVNAANVNLKQGGGVCGTIFEKAGAKQMKKACDKYSPIKIGDAIITPGFHLQAKYVIHAVGPIYQDGNHHEKELLESAYTNSLELAIKKHIHSISFPLISAGIYGYPKKEALDIAINTITSFLNNHELEVNIILLDKEAVKLSEDLYQNIEHYIDTYYEETRDRLFENQSINVSPLIAKQEKDSNIKSCFFEESDDSYNTLEELIQEQHETFSEMLLRLIDERHLTDVEVYKKANIDRKLFSKIRSNKDYHPKKSTVFSFAISLKLNLDETIDLLDTAGYSLSYSQKNDYIISYFIENKEYDIFKINEALFFYDLPLLAT
ncbi:MAG: macro domain-containing protein [Erysipelotrichaceae bacterium]|nr:macro domain-containing protein [Erysipelotrichaceae bacterium]